MTRAEQRFQVALDAYRVAYPACMAEAGKGTLTTSVDRYCMQRVIAALDAFDRDNPVLLEPEQVSAVMSMMNGWRKGEMDGGGTVANIHTYLNAIHLSPQPTEDAMTQEAHAEIPMSKCAHLERAYDGQCFICPNKIEIDHGDDAMTQEKEPELKRSKYHGSALASYSFFSGGEWNKLTYVPEECLIEIGKHAEYRQKQAERAQVGVTDEMVQAAAAEFNRRGVYPPNTEIKAALLAALAAAAQGGSK